MTSRTNKPAYRRHAYAGPRKSWKRVRAGLRRIYGEECLNRTTAWRSKEKKPVKEEIVVQNSEITQKPLRTYSRINPKIITTYSTSTSTTTAEPVIVSKTEIKTEPDPEINTEPDPEINTEPDHEIMTELDLEIETEANLEIEYEPDSEIDIEDDLKIETGANLEIEYEAYSEIEIEDDLEIKTEFEAFH
uniref:Uncharacterized protein n=1 Tax=Heliothis virescens TaxID=7102 RepID=A0A2A4JHM9_HELVI